MALVLTGCGGSDEPQRLDLRFDIVASAYPLAWMADELTPPPAPPPILRDDLPVAPFETPVANLTPPGVEPHDLELSPSDVKLIREAGLVIYVGGGFQPAVEDAVEERTRRSLDVLEEDDTDPHVWLDPARFAGIVRELGSSLGHSASARELEVALLALDREFAVGLRDCERRVFVTTHAAFGRLAARYELTELSLSGVSPEAEPSPRELEELIADVRDSGATTMFTEPLVSDAIARTVAREADLEIATLDPVESLSQERLAAGEDYLSVMRANLVALREALGCR